MLPFVSLSAATATGAGQSRDYESVLATHTMVATVTGSPTTWRVYFEGSLDGATWVRLGELNESSAPNVTVAVSSRPLRYVRANLDVLSGGSSPAATATIASV